LLQAMVNHLCLAGTLVDPLPIPGTGFPIVEYADDTLLIMQASVPQLMALKDLLQDFSRATGLKVNYTKSCIMPINVSEERIQILANSFGCTVGTLPFADLGQPLVLPYSPVTAPSCATASKRERQLRRRPPQQRHRTPSSLCFVASRGCGGWKIKESKERKGGGEEPRRGLDAVADGAPARGPVSLLQPP
jgi:hypothetical protein